MIDFAAVLRTFEEAGVEAVLVGGLAATVHGSARLTQDVDFVYSREPRNIERLARALRPHSPYLLGASAGLPFEWSAATIKRGLNFTLTTDIGDIDLLGEIPGGGNYQAHCCPINSRRTSSRLAEGGSAGPGPCFQAGRPDASARTD